jgi:ribonuclease HI
MKQQSIFDECTEPSRPIKKSGHEWKLFIDGASRKNPGLAGAGVYLLKNNKPVYQEGFYLGIKTNNEAEYLALLIGLFSCKRIIYPDDILYVISDSELLVKQMKGEYKVKKPELKLLHTQAFGLLAGINYAFCHVLRKYNKEADALANNGIDTGTPLPKDFVVFLASQGFSL